MVFRHPVFLTILLIVVAPTGVAGQSAGGAGSAPVGLLIMAHGGAEEWNASVAAAVHPLRDRWPTAVAYGMADPATLRIALDSLGNVGVRRVVVVRLFLSGQSFLRQTHFLLGLSDERPDWFAMPGAVDPDTVMPIAHNLEVATHGSGLMESPEAAAIVVERAGGASADPSTERVLLIAHGMGRTDENDRVVAAMARVADSLWARGFQAVRAVTLREDWADRRADAERAIRAFVADGNALRQRTIVVPFRLSGFGPYAEVLEGLDFVPTAGLLPHAAVSDWIVRTAEAIAVAEGWHAPDDPSAASR